MSIKRFSCFLLAFVLTPAWAQTPQPTLTPPAARPMIVPAPPQLAATAYLLMDAHTGTVLVENNADMQVPPASLTKMMTSYIVSEEMHNGKMKPEQMIPISVKAWRMGGSKMFIQEGAEVAAEDLFRGMVIQSGNDSTVALAEYISGSEDAFVDVMNQQAGLLGMKNTVYMNATGWPAEGHLTTARDLAILAKALINDYPEHYKVYAEKYFVFNGISQMNRNRLLFRDKTVDGIKTGHTEDAGFCLVASAVQNDTRLISVVLGTASDEARASESQKLMAYGFRYFETHKVFEASKTYAESRVWGGKEQQITLGVAKDMYVMLPRGSSAEITTNVVVNEEIKAPIEAGQELGRITSVQDGKVVADQPLVALNAVEEAGFFSRIIDMIKLFFFNFFN